MIDWYIYCNTVRLFSLFPCLYLDVGIDPLQEYLEIHLQKPHLVVPCLKFVVYIAIPSMYITYIQTSYGIYMIHTKTA